MVLTLDMALIVPLFIIGLAVVIYVARRTANIKTSIQDGNKCYWQAQEALNAEARQICYTDMIACYRKAIKLGSAEAITRMGHVYREGWGVEKDLQQAFAYYNRAARKSFHEAQYHLSLLYENGLGVDKDLKKAKHWRQRSQNRRFRVGF